MRRKSWTGLCRDAEALSVFERAERAERDLDSLFVVPADVGIEHLNELLDVVSQDVVLIEAEASSWWLL